MNIKIENNWPTNFHQTNRKRLKDTLLSILLFMRGMDALDLQRQPPRQKLVLRFARHHLPR